jgi:hypothetical protein
MVPRVNMCTVRMFFPFVEANREKVRSQAPEVPLTPVPRVCRIICGSHHQRPCRLLSIHIDGDCSASIRGLQEIHRAGSRACVKSASHQQIQH